MSKDDKIISFKDISKTVNKKRVSNHYELRASIKLDITRNDKIYNCTYYSKIPKEEVLSILNNVLKKMIEKNPIIKFKKHDFYTTSFTIFYYENTEKKDDFNFICSPQINQTKLTEYLWTFISVYDYKEANT